MKQKNLFLKSFLIFFALIFALLPTDFGARADENVTQHNSLKENTPLYSFGAISDVHIQYETGYDDFKRALTYLKDKVPFVCLCGDLVSYATEENMREYKSYVDKYSGGLPIYECAGNHDNYDIVNGEIKARTLTGEMLDRWINATGKEKTDYSFEYNGDVFIFLSLKSDDPDDLFTDVGLRWFADTLEKNKNKRCFVFQHAHDPEDDGADPSHSYSDLLSGQSGKEFLRLIKKYKNTVWFHGHTHLTIQSGFSAVNESLGYRSVHIPSLSGTRFYNEKLNILENFYYDKNNTKIWGALHSEGYIVDVYSQKIVIKGMNFAAGDKRNQVEPFENFCVTLNTPLVITQEPTTEKTTVTASETTEEATETPETIMPTEPIFTDPMETTVTSPVASEPATDFQKPTENITTSAMNTEGTYSTESVTTVTNPTKPIYPTAITTEAFTSLPADIIETTSFAVSDPTEEITTYVAVSSQPHTSFPASESIAETTCTDSAPHSTSKPIESETDNGISGDVNDDGKVNIKDATTIQKFAAKILDLKDAEKLRADVNADTKVNIKDATIIQKFVAKIETGFPLGKPIA